MSNGVAPSEMPYWTDKLTVNLVKLKRNDEALRWLDRDGSGPGATRVGATNFLSTGDAEKADPLRVRVEVKWSFSLGRCRARTGARSHYEARRRLDGDPSNGENGDRRHTS